MTVLIGILCEDGIVIGSDSSATFGTGHHPTIEQVVPDKTQAILKLALVAGTGEVGMGQRFTEVLSQYLLQNDPKRCTSNIQYACGICSAAINNFKSTEAPIGSFGALVAFIGANKSFALVEFPSNGFQPELKTKGIWFASMGSGQMISDPFLALVKSTLFLNGQPRLNEGIFAAVWALQHAIKINPGGINDPKQVGIIGLDQTGKFLEARMLSEDELSEHEQNVEAMTQHIAAYRDILRGKSISVKSTPPPTIPKS
jgi:hypothetical protein